MDPKRRKLNTEPVGVESAPASSSSDLSIPAKAEKMPFQFKNPNFVHSMKAVATSKRRVWKNLKQILTAEKALQWGPSDVTYSNLEAPPSFYPSKKYSDISGLPAKYVDPHTKLRYASAEEYAQIKTLPSDIIAGLLQIRKANNVVG